MKKAIAKQPAWGLPIGWCFAGSHFGLSVKNVVLIFSFGLLNIAIPAQQLAVTNDLHYTLSKARVGELPLISAVLVSQAPPRDRIATTRQVVRAAIRCRPATTVSVVGAIARSQPGMAATAAATAAEVQPDLACSIVQAAAAVAPECAGEIVEVVCSVVPSQYHEIALAAASAAPAASREILQRMGQVRTELTPYLDLELAKFPHGIPPVSRCLRNAERAQGRAGTGSDAGHQQGPPKRPKAGPPGQPDDKPHRGNDNPPGGRNYARP